MTAESIHGLVSQGFHEDNLRKLIKLCGLRLREKPSLYGSLIFIFASLADEYDNQAITVDRSRAVSAALHQPILALLDAELSSPDVFLSRLDDVFRGYTSLKRPI
jgi:hypothetical protein